MRPLTMGLARPANGQQRVALGGLAVLLLVSQFLLLAYSPAVLKAATPAVKLEKDSGEAGSALVMRGSGYDADQVIAIEVIQPNKPNTYPAELVYRMGLVVSDAKGEWVWRSFVPTSYVTTDFVNPGNPPQTNAFNGPLTIEAIRYDFAADRLAGAQLRYGTPEQKARVTFNITANKNNGPKLFNANGSLDSETFMQQLWNPLDLPVAVNRDNPDRGYIWGPRPFYATYEPYAEGSQNGYRPVIYFDKSRMENTAVKEPAFLTNGLLVTEMVSGRMQMGDKNFVESKSSEVFVAGDLGSNVGPKFSVFKPLLAVNTNKDGGLLNQQLGKDGQPKANPALDGFGVKATYFVKETKHFVGSVFLDYLNQKGSIGTLGGTPPSYSYGRTDSLFSPTFYATGYPITEPYWADVTVGGQTKQVLIQLFERRVLTFTPSNPDPYKVEMGNVGLQYFSWRYAR